MTAAGSTEGALHHPRHSHPDSGTTTSREFAGLG